MHQHQHPGDPEFAAILPAIAGPSGQFGHREHINLAFLAIRRYGMPEATAKVCGWIQQLTAYQRVPQKYNHTVSRAWLEIVAGHLAENRDCADFTDFADRYPALLDKRLLSRHYRSATLASAQARHDWIAPDLAPFPWAEPVSPDSLTVRD